MPDDLFPVRWTGRQAIVTFPAHIGVSNASQLSDRLLAVINRGAEVLVGDLTGTPSCDHSGVAAMARACQRAAIGGTRVQLVVTAPAVRRVLAIEELDRLVPIYPSLEAATGRATAATAVNAVTIATAVNVTAEASAAAGTAAQDHSGRAVAAPRRPRGWPVAGGSRRDDRPGQPAVRGDARLPARGADRPAARGTGPARAAGPAPGLPDRIRRGARGQADGRTVPARRPAQGRGHGTGGDQPEPGADRLGDLRPRGDPRRHRVPAAE